MEQVKFWEHPKFRAQQREWYLRLYEDGFTDVEGGCEDGYLVGPDNDHREGFTPADPEILDACAVESRAVADAVDGIHCVAAEALHDPGVWRGLPKDARRYWALQVLCDWTPDRAREFVGFGESKRARLDRIIRERVSARVSHE